MGRDTATPQVGAFHRLAALTAAQVADVEDATTVGTPQAGEPADVDLSLPQGGDPAVDGVTLVDALARRRTRREPPAEELDIDRLGRLLGGAARTADDGRRPHPSAGAAYPLRLDVVALRCGDVPAGVHRYEPGAHGLRTSATGDATATVEQVFGRGWVAEARAVLVISADLGEATASHDLRGYRYALLEAGHLAQSLLLLAAAADLPACPVGGFADRELGQLLGDRQGEVALYAVVL